MEDGKEPRSGCVPLRRGVGEVGRAGRNPAAVVYRSAGGWGKKGGLEEPPDFDISFDSLGWISTSRSTLYFRNFCISIHRFEDGLFVNRMKTGGIRIRNIQHNTRCT